MNEHETWQWQEPGGAWRGAALYHLTLTVTSRQPLLGTLAIPDNDPAQARVKRTPLGDALVDCLLSIQTHHPEVQVLHFCLMPDHLHAVLYVKRTMPTGIRTVARGFWQAAKKLGRAWTSAAPAFRPVPASASTAAAAAASPVSASAPSSRVPSSLVPNAIRENTQEAQPPSTLPAPALPSTLPATAPPSTLQEASARLGRYAASLRSLLGDDAYYRLAPLFDEKPFLRPMGHNTQLPTTIRYIDMNPQRLATKRLKPGFFHVQRNIEIAGRKYDGVGNTLLLTHARFAPVHVRNTLVQLAQHGNSQPLRNYKNSCVLMAREGCVMVSPFISPDEKAVMQVLLHEKRPCILLADNGFRDYYKPADAHFDACAAGLLLILSPWPYDAGKRHISRADCMALNSMAEEICTHLNALFSATTNPNNERWIQH